LLRKVNIDDYVDKIGLLNKSEILNAMIAERTLCARRERAVNTLQQLLARRISVMDAKRTLWERRVDAVGTL